MRALIAVVLLALASSALAASPRLDELLKQVKESQTQASQLNREREQRFLRDKNKRQAMLAEAEQDLAKSKARADASRKRFDAAQREIGELKQQLQERAGDYVQVTAAVRQLAGDFRTVASDSLVTAQVPDRMDFLEQIADSQDLPGISELEQLWYLLQEEMTEGGKVVRFSADVVDEQGLRRPAEVVRIGTFTAMADGRYLVAGDSGTVLDALPRQPGWSLSRLAASFADAEDAIAPALVDPSRGSLLVIEGEKPSLLERVNQGGLVGYVIILIGIVGIVLAVAQMSYLEVVGRRMRAQLKQVRVPRDDNPLGRVLRVFSDDPEHRDDDPELLELRLSEAVLREMPMLERAQSILKLFAAAAPLLGLLGTVTGMIVTFQTITVFGTGDPKLMADGISQALVTTVLGLCAAIPLLFINSLLATRARSLVQILDEQSAGLLAERLEGGRA
ncbi:MAG: MotA/TolQ/ExbB proton channel family protein [Nevskiales bacterium]|nr:MotA/TolQ/ExbB proton channel family protein [Nevskiales bacterium]